MQPKLVRKFGDRKGMALGFALLFALVIAALALGAMAWGSSTVLLTRGAERQSLLDWGAETGIEVARARLNADPTLYPDDGYTVLEDGEPILDAAGNPVPGVQRWLYVGPSGITSGQFGIFGMAVAIVRDGGGGVAIRRGQLYQESFARFAYFTEVEPADIWFGGGDVIDGPLHTNDIIKVHSTGATFMDDVRSGAGTLVGEQFGDFRRGFELNHPTIPLPPTTEFDRLRVQAQAGNTYFNAPAGPGGVPRIRIEFVARDLNGDGQVNGSNEGFIRVYRSNDVTWLMARVPPGGGSENPMRNSPNCGDYHGASFLAMVDHPASGSQPWHHALNPGAPKNTCHLGGSPVLSDGFTPNDARGAWEPWPGASPPILAGQPDAGYLFPITRELNPDFKGVIHVDGSVAISGNLRGRVTVSATGNVWVVDDLRYTVEPSTNTCHDILGMFAGSDVIIANNTLNTPVRSNPNMNSPPLSNWPAWQWRRYDPDMTPEGVEVHGIVLALNEFTVEGHSTHPVNQVQCGTQSWGRGCLFLRGGIIQRTRGAVGRIVGVNLYTGFLKRYSYDRCGATQPPPYFPTTGVFFAGQTYQVDPVGFDIDEFFDSLAF